MWSRLLPLLMLTGCGLSQCEELCATEADCLEKEITDFDSDWEAFTGFPDRKAFERECIAVYETSHEGGASRGDMQKLCRAELERACGADP